MGDAVATNTWVITCAIVVAVFAWKMVYTVWVRPKKMEKYLQKQGLSGNRYKLLYGDMKELSTMFQQSKSKHVDIDDGDAVLSHVVPFAHKYAKQHGRSFVTWMGWKPRVTILDTELIKDVLTKSSDFEKTRTNPLFHLVIRGLASYNGDQWIKHRKLINPAFHVEKVKNMVPAFQVSCSEMLRKWEKCVSLKESSCELDVWPHLQALTSDVISRTAFGSSYEEGIRIFELIRQQSVFGIQTLRSIYIPGSWFLPTKRNKRMKAIAKEIKHSIRRIIDKRLKAMEHGECNFKDLLGIMLESNTKEVEKNQDKSHGMTINEVIEECKLFYFAGQETTSSLLVWTMILLSRHQEWQTRAREEVLNVLGDNAMDLDGLSHLKVVNMIFYEVLRLYPPATALGRTVNKDITLGEFSLPSGTLIELPTMLIHYDEALWGNDAKKFNPGRFSQGILKATKNQVIYFPFGSGPRVCIGQNFALLESKIALSMILQRFSFEFSPSYVHAPDVVLTLQPEFGANLVLHKL